MIAGVPGDHLLPPNSGDMPDDVWAELDDRLVNGWLFARPPRTLRVYRADIARLRAWAGKPLRSVTPT